jgi:hypothetical protein
MWRFEGGLEIQSWGLGKERGGGNQYGVRNVYQRKQFTYQNQTTNYPNERRSEGSSLSFDIAGKPVCTWHKSPELDARMA